MLRDMPFFVESIGKDDFVGLKSANGESLLSGVTWQDEWGEKPPLGMLFYIVTEGFGHSNQGIKTWDGKVLKSKEDYEREAEARREERIRKDRARLEKNRVSWTEQIYTMDEPFRNRMNRFIEEKGGFSEFFLDFGDYELFVVLQAQGLYRVWLDIDADSTWFDQWYEGRGGDFESLKAAYPGLDEGHSGNTYGSMINLAQRVARGEAI